MAHDAGYQERIRSSFAKQGFMKTIGATLEHVSSGVVEIAMRPTGATSQQHGFTRHRGGRVTPV